MATKAAKKAPKPKAESQKSSVARAAAIRSWEDRDVAVKRAQRHKVRVNGEEYRSVRSAFVALNLPINGHQTFRKLLKEKGTMKFEGYNFKIIS
jgi:hypothetical protein